MFSADLHVNRLSFSDRCERFIACLIASCVRAVLRLFLNLCLHSASAFNTQVTLCRMPNLGARVPTDLNTDIPHYREYLESGLWCQRGMLRSVSGTGVVTYQPRPQDARVWPESLPTAVLAFEEANGGRKILSDTQRWKAQFAAYFLGAVSQAQLSLLEQTTNNTAGVAYASPNSWVVKTSKKLSYELRTT